MGYNHFRDSIGDHYVYDSDLAHEWTNYFRREIINDAANSNPVKTINKSTVWKKFSLDSLSSQDRSSEEGSLCLEASLALVWRRAMMIWRGNGSISWK